MREYFKLNAVPIIIEVAFITSCLMFPGEYFIYTNFGFYLLLLIYFLIKKEFSIREWLVSLKSGKKFWKQVIVTTIFFMMAFIITGVLESFCPNLNTGTIGLRRDTWLKLIIFAISTILLPPITEEIFYRRNMISFRNKKILVVTSILGMFLYALEHSLSMWGIFLTMIWALPLTVSYVRTKNIYVPMTAHFISNLIGNGLDVVMTVAAWL